MNTPSKTRVVVRRELSAAPDVVFECFSDAQLLSKWFYAGDATRCEARSEFHVGGSIAFRMFGPGEEISEHRGRWVTIERNTLLRMLWIHDGDVSSLVQFEFAPSGTRTRVTVTHTDLPEEMGALFEMGWAQCLGYLAGVLIERGKA